MTDRRQVADRFGWPRSVVAAIPSPRTRQGASLHFLAALCLIGSAAFAAETNGTTNRWPAVYIGERDAYDPDYNLVCVSRVRNGAKPAEASSSLADFPMHAAKGLNDGLYGNAHSWIADAEDKSPWFQIDLGGTYRRSLCLQP